jgi:predicted Zn-dependent protease
VGNKHKLAPHGWLFCKMHFVFAQAQHAQKKTDQALTTLNRAIASDPRSSLCKFHKASILLACDRHNVSFNISVII